MNYRQDSLLKAIVDEYIKTATPVGSTLIAEKYFPELSTATIRNEMAELEADGFITQPHVSAGRIPTFEGFRHYIEGLKADRDLPAKDESKLDRLPLTGDREDIKALAKKLSELSNDAVVVGFSPFDIYFTGLSRLFSQPEFIDNDLVHSVSLAFDDLDRVMEQVFARAGEDCEIALGEDNPFGDSCSAVFSKINTEEGEMVIAILGPTRMDYSRNLSLFDYLQKRLNSKNI